MYTPRVQCAVCRVEVTFIVDVVIIKNYERRVDGYNKDEWIKKEGATYDLNAPTIISLYSFSFSQSIRI